MEYKTRDKVKNKHSAEIGIIDAVILTQNPNGPCLLYEIRYRKKDRENEYLFAWLLDEYFDLVEE